MSLPFVESRVAFLTKVLNQSTLSDTRSLRVVMVNPYSVVVPEALGSETPDRARRVASGFQSSRSDR